MAPLCAQRPHYRLIPVVHSQYRPDACPNSDAAKHAFWRVVRRRPATRLRQAHATPSITDDAQQAPQRPIVQKAASVHYAAAGSYRLAPSDRTLNTWLVCGLDLVEHLVG